MIKNLLAIFSLLLFCGPGLMQAQQPDNDQDLRKTKAQIETALAGAGCGPSEVRFDVKTDKTQHPFVEPEAGKGLVYVFEEDLTNGYTPTTRVGLDGKWMGANHPDSYFFFSVEPGTHRLCMNWQETVESYSRLGGAVSFNAEAGKIYYFRMRITASRSTTVTVDLATVDSAEGQFLISSDYLSISRVKGPEPLAQQ